MQFNLAFIKNNNQFLLRNFCPAGEDRGKILGLEQLEDSSVQGLLYSSTQNENEDLHSLIVDKNRFFPTRMTKEIEINYEQFESLRFDEAKKLFEGMRESWVLQNNVILLEEMFKVIPHLLAIWPNDRTTFFEELWNILKNNLATNELKIIFHGLEKAKKENDRDKLVYVKIEGDRSPNPIEGGEIEEKIMKHYEENFKNGFEITEYNPDKGELVITANINKSPILIMAKIYGISRMQKAVIATLFDGLNFGLLK